MALKFLSSNQPNTLTAIIPDDDETYDVLPMVFFTNEAQRTIDYIVAQSKNEVAWLGTVEEHNGDYIVHKIFIPEQEVSGASVDITAEAMGKLVNEMMDQGVDPSTLRYHGHSHVNMDVAPSRTDQEHIAEYLEGVDWFIRSIHNKKGEKRIDAFEKFNQRVVNNVDSDVWEHQLPDEHYDQIDEWLNDRVQRQCVRPKLAARGTVAPATTQYIDNRALEGGKIEPLIDYADRLYGMRLDDLDDDDESYYQALIDPFYKGRA